MQHGVFCQAEFEETADQCPACGQQPPTDQNLSSACSLAAHRTKTLVASCTLLLAKGGPSALAGNATSEAEEATRILRQHRSPAWEG